jgi:hypothetical protein
MEWEYKTIRFRKKEFVSSSLDIEALDKQLNSYGSLGWELVSFETRTALLGNEIAAVAIFKKPAGHYPS